MQEKEWEHAKSLKKKKTGHTWYVIYKQQEGAKYKNIKYILRKVLKQVKEYKLRRPKDISEMLGLSSKIIKD